MLVTKSPTAVTVRPHADAFKGTARYYKYRPAYPPGVIKLLASRFRLNGAGRYLDLGCGPGTLAITLAKYFREVVALDPEVEMLAEGKSLARQRHISNIQWVGASSYELGKLKSILRPFDFVTIGTSFHWMDRAETLRQLYDIIKPQGGLAIVTMTELFEYSNAWQLVLIDIIKKWLGNQQRAGSDIYSKSGLPHIQFVAESPFRVYEQWECRMETIHTIDEILGYLYSTSYCSKVVLGPKRQGFEQDVRTTLAKINHGQLLKRLSKVHVILVWR